MQGYQQNTRHYDIDYKLNLTNNGYCHKNTTNVAG